MQKTQSHYLWLAAFLLMGVLALAVDVPVLRWCVGGGCPASLQKLLSLAELFGHGAGVLLICVTVAVLDVPQRWKLPRLLLAAFGSGLAANVVKLAIARTRPHHFDMDQSVAQSFLRWLPLTHAHSYEQSFPSSHVATAVGLAVGLSWLYPRGRWLFVFFALLAAGQRIESGAHFVSDTCFGATIGLAVGMTFTRIRSLGWLGNKLERLLGREPIDSTTLSHDARRAA